MAKSRNLAALLMKLIVSIIVLICLVAMIPYLRYTAYETHEPHPFAGSNWYNPYRDLSDTLLRVNFHAHSRSWGGLTWGENSAHEMIDAYAERGYQAPVLSNYHKITPKTFYPEPLIHIPVYEHGYNVKKVHCLCIGAHRVNYFDYPLHFLPEHTIDQIQRLRKHCDLVALAHPGARNAHVPQDMILFEGLQLMEVANTQGARTEYWDAMLSNGSAVWFLANDDTHDLNDGEAFMRWNMIYAAPADTEGAINALKKGNHYGVASYDGLCEDNRLTEFSVFSDTLRISLRDTFNRLTFIGQNGEHLYSALGDTRALYVLKASDTYIRAEVHLDHCVMYLNPVIRYDGDTLPHEQAVTPAINSLSTWVGRLLVLLVIGMLLYGLRWIMKPESINNTV